MNYTEHVDISLSDPKPTQQKRSWKNVYRGLVVFGVFGAVCFMGSLFAVVHNELTSIHDMLREFKPEINETLYDARVMQNDIAHISTRVAKTLEVQEFTLDMFVRFCRHELFRDNCLMPVPADYNYTHEMTKAMIVN